MTELSSRRSTGIGRQSVREMRVTIVSPTEPIYTSKPRRRQSFFARNSLASALFLVVTLSTAFVSRSYHHVALPTSEQIQLQIESRHPLAQRRRQLRATENESVLGTPKLRYLSFGSSNTWGIRLQEATAYPYLLDAEAFSAALPKGVTFADLAAACTQTLVGDWQPDIITVEYSTSITESHQILLNRLRRRFPSSVMVMVHLLKPATQLLVLKDAQNNTETLREWKRKRDAHEGMTEGGEPLESDASLRLARSMMEAVEKSDGKLWWSVSPLASKESKIMEMLRTDPLLLHYQLPMPSDLTDAEQLHPFLNLFSGDADVLSPQGHERVARDVQKLVESVPIPQDKNTGSWGSGDDCHIWYATGNYNLASTGQQVNLPQGLGEGQLVLSSHKHALEFTRSSVPLTADDNTFNRITVHNPFATDRMLSLTYLTDADSMSYPRTRVVVNGIPTVLLHPFHDDSETRHVARTSGVGYVPPGTSTLLLDPMQSTVLPFRLLGASLLAEEVQDLLSIEFALESDSLVTENDDQVHSQQMQQMENQSVTGFWRSLFRR